MSAGGSSEALIIDPGGDAVGIIKALEGEGLKLTHVLLTHGHYDHTGAAAELMEKYGAPLAVQRDDAAMLNDPKVSVRPPMDWREIPEAEIYPEDGDTLYAAGLEISVLRTPGHTRGGLCYIIGDYLFSGDTLFAGSIGRTDLPTGGWDEMQGSLKKLAKLRKNYIVCPGHGPASTLEDELRTNPYLNH